MHGQKNIKSFGTSDHLLSILAHQLKCISVLHFNLYSVK